MSLKNSYDKDPMMTVLAMVTTTLLLVSAIDYLWAMPAWALNHSAWIMLGGSIVLLLTNMFAFKYISSPKGKIPLGSLILTFMAIAGILLGIFDLIGKAIPSQLELVGFVLLVAIAILSYKDILDK